MECPQCGEPEILRKEEGDTLDVIFGCLLYVRLDARKDDVENQCILDEWKRTGGLEAWLRKPFGEGGILIIRDRRIVEHAKKRFEKMWREAKPLTSDEEGESDNV